MRIRQVQIENIKNCESASYLFESGTNAICGPNGAGKTTIVEAISWALFDHLPYKKANFIRHGAKKGSVRVTVDFGEMGEYCVERDTGTLYRIVDPLLKLQVAEGKADSTAWLKRAMGLDQKDDLETLFTSSIGVPQGTFANDFNLQPSRRKQIFDGLLKVEEYRETAEQLGASVNFARERLQEIGLRLAKCEGELDKLPELKEQRERWQNEQLVARERLDGLNVSVKEAKIRVERFNRLQEMAALAEAELERTAQAKSFQEKSLAQAIARLKEASEAAAEIDSISPEVALYRKAENEGKELEKQRLERDALEKQRQTIQEGKLKSESKLGNLDVQLKAICEAKTRRTELEPLEARQKILQGEIAQLQQELGRYEEQKKQISLLSREIEEIEKNIAALTLRSEKLFSLEEDAKKHPALVEKREKILAVLPLAKEREQKQQQLLAQEERIKKVQGEIRILEESLQAKSRLEESAAGLPALEEVQDRIKQDIADLNAELKRLDAVPGQLEGGRCPILDVSCPSLSGGNIADSLQERREALQSKRAERVGQFNEVKTSLSEAQKAKNSLVLLCEKDVRLDEAKRHLAEETALKNELSTQLAALPGDDEKTLQREISLLTLEVEKAAEASRLYASLAGLNEQLLAQRRNLTKKREEVGEIEKSSQLLSQMPDTLRERKEELTKLGDPKGEANVLSKQIEKEAEVLKEKEKSRMILEDFRLRERELSEKLAPHEGLDTRLGEANLLRERFRAAFIRQLGLLPIAESLPLRTGEKERAYKDFREAVERFEAAEKRLAESRRDYQKEPHVAAQQLLEDVRAQQTKLELQLNFFLTQIEEKDRAISRLMELRTLLAEDWKEKERWERTLEFIEFARQTLKSAGPRITEAYLMNVSLRANQLYRAIAESEGDLSWGRDYEISLAENGHVRPFANLSGGEQMAAALAVRLALIREVSDLDVAFFDEPTTNLDEERRKNLARQISQIRDFSQLFVISHDDTFEESTDHVVKLAN